jgi:hypothetical protein
VKKKICGKKSIFPSLQKYSSIFSVGIRMTYSYSFVL